MDASASASLPENERRAFVGAHPGLAGFKRPRYYRFVDRLPMTATGKKQHIVASRWAREDFQTAA